METTDNYYLINGKKYYRVTKVKSVINHEGLNKWRAIVGDKEAKRVLKERGELGTKVHNIFEKILNGEDINTTKEIEEIQEDVLLFYKFLGDCNILPSGVEQKLWSKKLMIAGTADYIGNYKTNKKYLKRGREPKFDTDAFVIGDWKTSSSIYEDYWIQLATYAHMFEEKTKKKLDGGFIAQFRNGKLKIEEKTRDELKIYYEIMKHCIPIFKFTIGEY